MCIQTWHWWQLVSILLVLTCVPALVSGVYFEKVLKSSDTSLWVRNIQMYLSGIVVTLMGVFMKDGENVLEKGFFFGYTPWVCFVVCKYHKSGECFLFLFTRLPQLFGWHCSVCAVSAGQRGRSVHVGGGEVHGQHHERLLRRGRHRHLHCSIRHLVWPEDK